jgi:hypothetical protein
MMGRGTRAAVEQQKKKATRPATTDGHATPAPSLVSHSMGLQSSVGNAGTTADIQRRTGSGPSTTPSAPMQTAQQQRVLDDKAERAAQLSKDAAKKLLKAAKKLGYTADDLETVKDQLRRSELTINFDASKKIGDKPLPELFTDKDARVKNMFETGSSGGASDFMGREGVERGLFGYDQITPSSPMSEKAERPKYAALNPTTSPLGGADRSSYGSSALVLNDAVRSRMTITPDDTFSYRDRPDVVGTFDHLDHVLLARMEAKRPEETRALFDTILAHARGDRGHIDGFDYLEGQIHGDVDIARDVAYIRANFNEAFGTAGGDALRRLGSETRPVIWSYSKKRDVSVLEPTRGAAKDAFDALWQEVAAKRDPSSASKPLSAYSAALGPLWAKLIAAMPPMNLSISGDEAKGVGQVSGRDDSNPIPKLDAASLTKALGH